ncbi:hypothetical protein B0H14DRAFT_3166758 [Mycena olivaceomarginata]|nr:hypothetical protein B0H14DRAFT_3166758 [Mycena olivaceomarginata]
MSQLELSLAKTRSIWLSAEHTQYLRHPSTMIAMPACNESLSRFIMISGLRRGRPVHISLETCAGSFLHSEPRMEAAAALSGVGGDTSRAGGAVDTKWVSVHNPRREHGHVHEHANKHKQGVRARTSKAKAETVLYALKATKAFTELEALLRVRSWGAFDLAPLGLQSAVGVFDACDDMRMIQRDECGKHSLFLPSIQAGFTRVDPPLRRKVKDVIFVWFWTPALCPTTPIARAWSPSLPVMLHRGLWTWESGGATTSSEGSGDVAGGRGRSSLDLRVGKSPPPHPTSPHLEPFKPRDLAGAVVNLMNCVREVRRAVKRTHSSAPHACAPRTRTLRDHGLTHHRVWAEDSRGAPGGVTSLGPCSAYTLSDENGDVLSARRYCSKPSPSGRLSTSLDSESRSNTAPQARTERPPRGAASRVGLRPRQEGLGGERVPVGTCADPLVRKMGCKVMPDAARTDPSPIAAWTRPRWCGGSGASTGAKGNGEGRYTTTRSGIRVDEAKAQTKILRRWKRGSGRAFVRYRDGGRQGGALARSASKIGETHVGFKMLGLVWAEGERIGWASCASDGDDQEHNVGVGSNPLIRTEAVLVFPAECLNTTSWRVRVGRFTEKTR